MSRVYNIMGLGVARVLFSGLAFKALTTTRTVGYRNGRGYPIPAGFEADPLLTTSFIHHCFTYEHMIVLQELLEEGIKILKKLGIS